MHLDLACTNPPEPTANCGHRQRCTKYRRPWCYEYEYTPAEMAATSWGQGFLTRNYTEV